MARWGLEPAGVLARQSRSHIGGLYYEYKLPTRRLIEILIKFTFIHAILSFSRFHPAVHLFSTAMLYIPTSI